jgi:hypothetical protein
VGLGIANFAVLITLAMTPNDAGPTECVAITTDRLLMGAYKLVPDRASFAAEKLCAHRDQRQF